MNRVAALTLWLLASGCDSSSRPPVPSPSPSPSPAAAPAAPAAPAAAPAAPATFDLRQVRRVAVGETVDPPALSVDGDYLYFKSSSLGTECGALYKSEPHEAVFVICGSEVLAGPLTTEAQIAEVFSILNDRSRSAHEATMAVMNGYPSGGLTRYRVYDHNGRYLGER